MSKIELPDYLSYLEINEELQEAYNTVVDEKKNLLLTGPGGVGKSEFINILEYKFREKNIVFLAPTGVAAWRIDGQTIHSFFNLPPSLIRPEILEIKKEKIDLMNGISMIVIDEIFMCRVDLIDAIDSLLKRYRLNDEPFGGVQMIFVGDLYQLPPIIQKKTEDYKYIYDVYEGHYFFNAYSYKESSFKKIELKKIYRQSNREFSESLNRIRKGLQNNKDLFLMNRRVISESVISEKHPDYVYLTPFNKVADEVNMKFLDALDTPPYYITAEYEGEMNQEKAKKNFNAPTLLVIKPGAKIMMLNNDRNGGWINGSIGFVEEVTTITKDDGSRVDAIIVDIDGRSLAVEQFSYTKYRYGIRKKDGNLLSYNRATDEEKAKVEFLYRDKNKDNLSKQEIYESIKIQELGVDGVELGLSIEGVMKQFPMKLAYAITIHKSQSATFNAGVIDLGKYVFAEGMTYVALSRFKSLENIAFKRPIRESDIKVNIDAAKFLEDHEVVNKYEKVV